MDCLYLTKEVRRYFITTIKHTQEQIEKKLEEEGYKEKILDALAHDKPMIKYLLNYFKNEVVIKDPKMFKRNAPKTEDFHEMVQKNREGIKIKLDDRLNTNAWPFENNTDNGGRWVYETVDPNKGKDDPNRS